MNINEVKKFVKEKHDNQTRIQGTPYYLHPYAVADILKENGYGTEYQITALFHDLIEDTNTTYEELLKMSNQEVTDAVKLLTKEKDYQMKDYITRIKDNKLAKQVKLADRLHNLSEAHYASNKWIKKYIIETKEWYYDLAKDTIFENDINKYINELEQQIAN